MHKQLIIAAFQKAKTNAQTKGVINPSKSRMAEILSDYLSEKTSFPFGDKQLKNYYNKALGGNDINIAQEIVIDGLCNYIGYESYQEFLNAYTHNSPSSEDDKKINTLSLFKKYKTHFLLVLSTVALVISIVEINKQRWMIWNGETYEEQSYNQKLLREGMLKPYDAALIENFKKLKDVDCNTVFFNPNGSVKVWYRKHKADSIECFTSHGLHPVTDKTLKPITPYIINKYLCGSIQ